MNFENNVIVKVGNETLYQQELDENLSSFFHPEDSILAAEHYIRNWINDRLLYDIAQKNIQDKKGVDRLVENYRRSLIIHRYQEQLINEKLTSDIDENLLLPYYEANKDKFQLDYPMIKGLFVKVPIEAPHIDNIRKWYKSLKESDSENIERYCVQNSALYDNFTEQWISFLELTDNWPVKYSNITTVVKSNKYIEERDSNYYYFLHITNYLLPGDTTPFEYSKPIIRDILINQRKVDFLKKTEEDLYQRALNRREIHFYKD